MLYIAITLSLLCAFGAWRNYRHSQESPNYQYYAVLGLLMSGLLIVRLLWHPHG